MFVAIESGFERIVAAPPFIVWLLGSPLPDHRRPRRTTVVTGFAGDMVSSVPAEMVSLPAPLAIFIKPIHAVNFVVAIASPV